MSYLLSEGPLLFWGTCLVLGGYLMYIHHDFWMGIPVFAVGTMIFWGFAYDGICFIRDRIIVKQPNRRKVE